MIQSEHHRCRATRRQMKRVLAMARPCISFGSCQRSSTYSNRTQSPCPPALAASRGLIMTPPTWPLPSRPPANLPSTSLLCSSSGRPSAAALNTSLASLCASCDYLNSTIALYRRARRATKDRMRSTTATLSRRTAISKAVYALCERSNRDHSNLGDIARNHTQGCLRA